MSVYSEFVHNPCAETWQAIKDEAAKEKYLDNNHTPRCCVECPHFTSSEFAPASLHYEVGICEPYALDLHANNQGMGEAITTADNTYCFYENYLENCGEVLCR